ncbi:hypothetical protein [Methylomonas methanica]|uniref:Uncharacterized protein n=1 Tax=Methylomonas methanica (strain DSM 25384 / MC09) TaxID=857087 RepID=G0A3T7_METMM|nr:hypothetical protein [Methylomonas methanica]AEG02709.1 hypothetical protein Metme_4361 [Methylomonas methanica MC09]
MPTSHATAITKKRFEAAIYSRERLSPAVDSLAKIDVRSLNVFDGGNRLIDQVTDCLSLLQDALAISVAIVEKGQKQYDDRDQALLSAASSRYMQIDGDIEATKHQQESLIDTYKQKIEELIKRQFSQAEIDSIVVNPDEEISALDVVVDELRNEKLKIQKYLADAPLYDAAYLVGTRVPELAQTRLELGIGANPFSK